MEPWEKWRRLVAKAGVCSEGRAAVTSLVGNPDDAAEENIGNEEDTFVGQLNVGRVWKPIAGLLSFSLTCNSGKMNSELLLNMIFDRMEN